MKSAHQLLVEAKALIADPAKWTQGAYARDVNGDIVGETSERAVCFCSMGALYKVACSEPLTVEGAAPISAAVRALSTVAGESIVAMNDHWRHEAVMEMFDKAIEATKGTV